MRKKKLLSLLLAICMVVTLLPMQALKTSASNAEYRVVYSFGSVSGDNHSLAANKALNTVTYSDTHGLWKFLTSADDTKAGAGQAKGGRFHVATEKDAPWAAVTIRVPVANTYTVAYVIFTQADSQNRYGKGNVYLLQATDANSELVKTDIDQALTTATILAENIDYSGTKSDYVLATTKVDTLTLEQGEYIVIFKATEANLINPDGYRQSPSAIVLSTSGAANKKDDLGYDTPIYTGVVSATATEGGTAAQSLELEVGETATASGSVVAVADGFSGTAKGVDYNRTSVGVTYTSSNPEVATVDTNGLITAVKAGTAIISAVPAGGAPVEGSVAGVTITVLGDDSDTSGGNTSGGDTNDGDISGGSDSDTDSEIPESLTVTDMVYVSDVAVAVGGSIQLDKSIFSFEGNYQETDIAFSFENKTPDVLTLTPEGMVTGVKDGAGLVEIAVSFKGTEVYRGEYNIPVGSIKSGRSYYTEDKITNARNNIVQYDWAQAESATAIAAADKILELGIDRYYDLITTQELPRSIQDSYRAVEGKLASGSQYCIDCNKKNSAMSFDITDDTRVWKAKCKSCGNQYPSNDFGSFYDLGIDENGNWSYMQALQKHHEMFVCEHVKAGAECTHTRPAGTLESWKTDVENRSKTLKATGTCPAPTAGERGSEEWNTYYGYGLGYLKNDLYPEKNDAYFAVDDGWGYEYLYTNTSGKTELRCKPYIALYNRRIWTNEIPKAVENLGLAYIYTGEEKYGIAGAILLDRIADVWPDMDTSFCGHMFPLGDGLSGSLGTVFRVDENGTQELNGKKGNWFFEYPGKVVGRLHDATSVMRMVPAYDALWPAFEEPEVIAYLSAKADEYDLENSKESASLIKLNIENNFLRELNQNIRDYKVGGNFGVPQKLHALLAVVFDTMPESQEWLDFNMQTGGQLNVHGREDYFDFKYTGGNILNQLYIADREGFINETAPSYNVATPTNYLEIGTIINDYGRNEGVNLFTDEKFLRIALAPLDVLMASKFVPNEGDHEAMGEGYTGITMDYLMGVYEIIKDKEEYSNYLDAVLKQIYVVNGYSTEGIRTGIFDADPNEPANLVAEAVKDGMEIKLPSNNLTGYGLAILRGGNWINSESTEDNINNQYAYYTYYGQRTNNHVHADALNLGFYAYGFSVGEDLGSVETKTQGDPYRDEVVGQTISHNTVTVDEVSHPGFIYSHPLHFDATDRVQLMDVSVPGVYDAKDNTAAQFANLPDVSDYRRTVVTVEANDDIAYAVDFFHVKGGNTHTYSFHALGEEAELTGENVVIASQKDADGNYIGSYEGTDKLWGGSTVSDKYDFTGVYRAGQIMGNAYATTDGLGTYSWFGEVDRVSNVSEIDTFSMDWKIDDYHQVMQPLQNDLHVRLTMVNSFELDEIATTSLKPPYNSAGSVDSVRYLLATHKEEGASEDSLESLFTSVIEPYKGERYISDIQNAQVVRADGQNLVLDEVKAVKVTLANGREDYIVYAKDSAVSYKVTYGENKTFDFCGFVGVVSVNDGNVIYTYLNDGTTIDTETGINAAYTGNITGFQKERAGKGYIDVALESTTSVDLEALKDKYIYIEQGKFDDNRAYRIVDATNITTDQDTTTVLRLNIGDVTLITGYKDLTDESQGYLYNIAEGQTFRIPLNYVDNKYPSIGMQDAVWTVKAGESLKKQVSATSPVSGTKITYNAVQLPEGAVLDSNTGTITWTPGITLEGTSFAVIDAVDEAGRSARGYFEFMVEKAETTPTPIPISTPTPSESPEASATPAPSTSPAPTTSPKLEILEGTDAYYVEGTDDTVDIHCNGELKDFVRVDMDGQTVDKSNYSIEEGSTILSFKNAYLNTLAEGEHTVTLHYTGNRTVVSKLTILAAASDDDSHNDNDSSTEEVPDTEAPVVAETSSTKTGDDSNILLWMVLLVVAIMAASGYLIIRKRKGE